MRTITFILALPVILASSLAYADVANDPCELLDEGDACETLMGEDGFCVDGMYGLECEVPEDGAGGAGGADNTPPSDDDEDEGEGCSVQKLGSAGGSGAAALLAIAGLFLATRRRQR